MTSFYKDKNVLVLGGGGFIGSHLVELLVEAGANVRVAQRSYPGKNLFDVIDTIEFVHADLLNLKECVKAMKGVKIAFVLAGNIGGIEYNLKHPATMFYSNSIISLNVLEAGRLEGVEKLMCTSSDSIYSPWIDMPYLEKDGFIGDPDEASLGYAWAKRVAELGAKFYAHEYGMKIAIVRPSNTFGPRDNFEPKTFHVIPALIRKVFESRESIEVWGSGNQTRSFTYVKDVARAMMLLTERAASAVPVNIGSGEEMTIKELINLIIKISGKDLVIKFETNKPEGQLRKAIDTTKISEEFNWEPVYSIENGLKKTIEWFLENCQE